MKEQRLKETLRAISEYIVPDTIDIWPDILNEINSQTVTVTPKSSLATKRLGWIAVTLVTVLLFVSVAYAFSPLIRNLLKLDPVLDAVDSKGFGHPLNLTQIREGVGVTLDWIYADENRIAIAYSIRGDAADLYQPVSLTLSDNTGGEFHPFVGMGTPDLSGVGLLPNQGGYVFSFDTSSISDQPDSLDLHLEIVLESSDTEQLLPPFVFDFVAPFTPTSRIVEPKQTVTVADMTITLEKVIVTPGEVRTVMCFDDPVPDYMGWSPMSNIDVKFERSVSRAEVGQIDWNEAGCVSSLYFPSLYDVHGSWTLTVTELVGFREGKTVDEESMPKYYICSENENESVNSEYCPEQLRIQGPWVFEFEMP